jgi:hypothetical protein
MVAAAACSGGGPPPASAQTEAQVRAAYLDAWSVRDDAVHRSDPSLLSRRYVDEDPSSVVGNLPAGTEGALPLVSASVAARIQGGVDVKGDVGHAIASIDVADDGRSAQVMDTVTDRTYLVNRATGQQVSSSDATTDTQVWFLVMRGGDWKVIYFATTAAPSQPSG